MRVKKMFNSNIFSQIKTEIELMPQSKLECFGAQNNNTDIYSINNFSIDKPNNKI